MWVAEGILSEFYSQILSSLFWLFHVLQTFGSLSAERLLVFFVFFFNSIVSNLFLNCFIPWMIAVHIVYKYNGVNVGCLSQTMKNIEGK